MQVHPVRVPEKSGMLKNRALAVLTLGLAPYRAEYFFRLATNLQKYLRVVILQRSAKVARYHWRFSAKALDLRIITVSGKKVLQQKQHAKTTLRKGFFQNPPTWRQCCEIFRLRPALIYSSEASLFCWPALLYSFFAGIPLILESDMGPLTRWRLSLIKRWNQCLFRKQAALIIGRTQDFLKEGPKTIFAPHAVSAARFRPAQSKQDARKSPIFLFVGVPSYTKGLDLFAQAAALACKKAVFDCRIIGPNPLQARALTKIFQSEGFRGSLSFRSFLSGGELIKEYQKADVFVFPSRFDTYGVVVHEATCCGLPVVVSCHAGASRNLVVEGKNGYVINPENTGEFAARLIQLARNPRLRVRMGRASRRRGVAFSVEKQSLKVSRRILRLLAKGSKPSLGPRA